MEGLDKQHFSVAPTPSVYFIVVDNSPAGDAAEICSAHEWAWPLTYLHEPRPGISHARNTALRAVRPDTDFIAMVDDDEVPAPNWLDQLLDTQAQSGADIVVGPTTPVFPPGTPAWVAASGFFLKPRNPDTLRNLDPDPPAATCNVLVRASMLRESGLLFDPALALSGGEDKLIFQTLKQRGYRFAWSAGAHVSEWIPAERANLAYMWRESYRRGAVRYYVKRHLKSGSALHTLRMGLRISARSLVRVARNFLRMLGSLRQGRHVWVPFAMDIADGLGVLAGVLQIPNRHYRPKDSSC